MAEEFVRREHFEEFARRMDERFLGVERRMEQGFSHAEKAREQNFVHLNKRFDNLEKRMDQFQADMRQMRGWLVGLFGLVVFGFLGSIVLVLLRGTIVP